MADKKRIHPSFSMTGRSTAAKPEMQRLPPRTEEARRIRDALMDPSYLIQGDYETVELRILDQMREIAAEDPRTVEEILEEIQERFCRESLDD